MKFMIIRKADENTEAGTVPSEQLVSAMNQYHQDLADAQVLRGAAGLQPSSEGVRVKFSAGRPAVTDGPFIEAKELIAGYTIIEVGSKAEAIDWVARWPKIDGDGEVDIEIRPILDYEGQG
jgi:hypothetical protein